MADTYAIEDVGSMDRRGNSPPMDEPGAPLGGGRGQKYGASPDVRNAVTQLAWLLRAWDSGALADPDSGAADCARSLFEPLATLAATFQW